MNPKKPRALCLNCGAEVKTPVAIYCTNQCQLDYQWKSTKTRIEETGLYPASQHSTAAKRYLKEKFGNVCAICGITEWCGRPVLLIMDHIDGNYENCKVENVRLICANCDTQTPFFKNKNKGNGRYSRRLRYQEGKSY